MTDNEIRSHGAARQRWRHKKRGTSYVEVGRGLMQSVAACDDNVPVIVYRSEQDGRLWVRSHAEFYDGRFEQLPYEPPARPKDDQAVRAAVLREAAYVARNACLVDPDGGSPTEAETRVCDEAERRILALIARTPSAQPEAQAEPQGSSADLRPGLERAYGTLWQVITADKRVHAARRLLLDLIGKDGQRRGIEWAVKEYGPISDAEILAADTTDQRPDAEAGTREGDHG